MFIVFLFFQYSYDIYVCVEFITLAVRLAIRHAKRFLALILLRPFRLDYFFIRLMYKFVQSLYTAVSTNALNTFSEFA